jgi:hypothetical protein
VVLYAVDGAGLNDSSLYVLDPATGAAQLIGPTGFEHINGLAVHPINGTLYGVTSDPAQLITIDPATGLGTLVAPISGDNYSDISFSSTGVLYGWKTYEELHTIDLATGLPTLVGDCGCSATGTGIAFDSSDTLYMKEDNDLHLMDSGTGQILASTPLSDSTKNVLTFGPGGVLYTGDRGGGQFTLETIDPATGVVTTIGSNGFDRISAIAFRESQADGDGDGIGDLCDLCPPDPTNDVDGDLVCGAVDNCPLSANPDQLEAPFSGQILAIDNDLFAWNTPQDIDWIQGELSSLGSFAVSSQGSEPSAVTLSVPQEPSPGVGLWWLVRPACSATTWSTGVPGECPPPACPGGDRDGSLPECLDGGDCPSGICTAGFCQGNRVTDPGFEAGPFGETWDESSAIYGTPLCDVAGCGTGAGSGPRSGTFWAWFGGFAGGHEEGSVSQQLRIPAGAGLTFYLEQPACDDPVD